MAAPAKEEKAQEEGSLPVQPTKSKSKLIILLAFISVILLELIVAFLLLPSKPDTTAAPKSDPSEIGSIVPHLDPSMEDQPKIGETIEYPIPDPPFSVSVQSDDGMSNMTIKTKFVLVYNKADEKVFLEKFPLVQYSIKSDIQVILRRATQAELGQDNQRTICNKVLKAINDRLQVPLVKRVFALDFTFEVM